MFKPAVPLLMIGLLAATSAHAQYGGGGGPGGGGHGHRGGGGPPGGSAKSGPGKPPPAPEKPVNQIEIVGVIRAIDPASGRITIAYEPVDELNWPAGTMPFVVGKTALLKDATVGEKIRFKLDNQQISALRPF